MAKWRIRYRVKIGTQRRSLIELSSINTLRQAAPFLAGHIRNVTLNDDQMGLDQAQFSAQRQIVALLDVRGRTAFENGGNGGERI